MEAEVVRMTANLFHGGPHACGTVIIWQEIIHMKRSIQIYNDDMDVIFIDDNWRYGKYYDGR